VFVVWLCSVSLCGLFCRVSLLFVSVSGVFGSVCVW